MMSTILNILIRGRQIMAAPLLHLSGMDKQGRRHERKIVVILFVAMYTQMVAEDIFREFQVLSDPVIAVLGRSRHRD